MRRVIVGIMGPGKTAKEKDIQLAEQLGTEIARNGWVTLTGGRPIGVMEAALKGAASQNGLTLGILPDEGDGSDYIDIAVKTGIGNARNSINILTSDVVVAIGMGPGTASEVALAIKSGKPPVLLNVPETAIRFFRELYPKVVQAEDVSNVICHINEILVSK